MGRRMHALVIRWGGACTPERSLSMSWRTLVPPMHACARGTEPVGGRASLRAGQGDPLVGGGWDNPAVPATPSAAPLPHPGGYMRYRRTAVACPQGCTLGGPVPVGGAAEAVRMCNATAGCAAFELTAASSNSSGGGGGGAAPPLRCQLLSAAGPGAPNALLDTFVRVWEPVLFDFTGTYNAAPPVCPGAPGWACARYANSWMPNATADGAAVFPYEECAAFQAAARGNHSADPVPYVASVVSAAAAAATAAAAAAAVPSPAKPDSP